MRWRGSEGVVKYMKTMAIKGTSKHIRVSIAIAVRRLWRIDKDRLFRSLDRSDPTVRIFKFCYQPVSGELIFDGSHFHADMIRKHGRRKFDDYVRGICFWKKRIIYLRGHENETWLKKTKAMLRQNGVGRHIRIIWGEKAALELRHDLAGL